MILHAFNMDPLTYHISSSGLRPSQAMSKNSQLTNTHVTKTERTYRTVQHAISLIAPLFDMTLQSTRVEGFQEFKATEQFG